MLAVLVLKLRTRPRMRPLSSCNHARSGLTFTFRKALDPAANLSYGYGADVDAALIFAQPSYHVRLRHRFDCLTEGVCVHQIAHNATGSESSESRGGISNSTGQDS